MKKLLQPGGWVMVRPFFNHNFPTDGLCSLCKRASCAPGWLHYKTKEFRCTQCFDPWES